MDTSETGNLNAYHPSTPMPRFSVRRIQALARNDIDAIKDIVEKSTVMQLMPIMTVMLR